MTNTNSNNSVTETVDPPKEEPTKPFDENSFEAYLTQQGFPDDYKAKLKELHKQYPSWVFIGRKTGFSFSQAVTKETRDGISLIHSAYPLSYRDKGSASYDSNTGKYIPKDGSVWFNANKSVVEYYMDPRNFLNEEKIYMFLDQSYQKYQSEMAVYKIIKDNALGKNGYQTEWFIEAGRKYEISPISLAIRASSEVGGGSIACSGKVIDGKKYYNPFNIGAYSGENPLSAGMEYAKKQGWDTKQKAIEGAAKMLSNSYLKNNQHTQYYQKFNVANGLSYVATYQYMTNIMAPYLEATYTKNTYSAYGITGEQLVFEIPIYTDMPSATKLP